MIANGAQKSTTKIASGTRGAPALPEGDVLGIAGAALGELEGDRVRGGGVGGRWGVGGGGGGEMGEGGQEGIIAGGLRGAMHVLFMNSNGTVKSTTKIASGTGGGPTLANGDEFGSSVASLGDLDGD